ncbi:ABC transporter permease (plasmid) [Thermus thermophilus]|uniref:ABC transporter permease n=1 Tax=Thermus thermophilus TaxID=274 RepID=A0AAD1NZ65_THETH|nr:ABC transporter permease subunit [Thermus thermophilus]BBL83356.1 ABC transporter permease [Thermus thermophilus]BBL85629.1 ABC transporter permease [Thermus thermophilus]BCZ88026.1 ABC transporter permease [Thermus thermophilus]BCZ90358.1 ABC transporter permease [Thermus thermophilus]BCZ93012.1 ABC transporter permease [Thermus thermophilus]
MRPTPLKPNRYDLLALAFILVLLALFLEASREAAAPFTPAELSLDPRHLPGYALRTAFRMGVALLLSLAFTLVYAPLAAKTRLEPFLVSLLDILQSVPVLGFLAATAGAFAALFPGRALGLELSAIFAVFTSQAWNMAFSFYQSLKTLPKDLLEVAALYRFTPWQRFLRLELPFALPGLVWNGMMSMSGGWFFVVASEAIAVGKTQVELPGIGAYLATAIAKQDGHAVLMAVGSMLLVILLYDQLFFRPLVAWSQRFKYEERPGPPPPRSWVLDLLSRSRVVRKVAGALFSLALEALLAPERRLAPKPRALPLWPLALPLLLLGAMGAWALWRQAAPLGLGEVGRVFLLGFFTLLRVLGVLALAALVWVPVGILLGSRPSLAQRVQAFLQVLAAFPANLLYPPLAYAIVHRHLSLEVFSAFLMVLGTQWYILFNAVAGSLALPQDLKEAARSFGLRGLPLWRRLLLPGTFPYLVTGLITASGGTWNASIVAEVVQWGNTTWQATGLGSYITFWTLREGQGPHLLLGIAVMSLYVAVLNRLLWRRLYRLAEERFRL